MDPELIVEEPSSSSIITRAKQNFKPLFLCLIFGRAFFMMATIFSARALKAEGFGILGLLNAIGTSLLIFSTTAVGDYGVREIAGAHKVKEQNKIIAELFFLNCIFSCIITVAFLVTTALFKTQGVKQEYTYLWSLVVFFGAIDTWWVAMGKEWMWFYGIREVLMGLLFMTGILTFVHSPTDIVAAIVVKVVSVALPSLGMVASVFYRFRQGLFYELASLATYQNSVRHIVPALTFGLSAIFVQFLTNWPFVVLAWEKGDVAVGIYRAVYTLIYILIITSGMLAHAFRPIIAQKPDSKDHVLKTASVYLHLMLVWIFATPIIFYLAKDILDLVYGSDYSAGLLVFRISLLTVTVTFLNMVFGQSLLYSGYQKIYTFGLGLGATINLITTLFFIPRLGINGAAVAWLVTETSIFLFIYKKFRQLIGKLSLPWEKILKASVACLVSLFCLWTLEGVLTEIWLCILSSIIYLTLIDKLKIFPISKILNLRG